MNPSDNLQEKNAQKKQSGNHKQQIWLQILLPIILAFILLIAGIFITSAQSPDGQSIGHWASLSTIILVIPVIFLGLFVLIVLISLVYGVGRLYAIIPYYAKVVKTQVFQIEVSLILWLRQLVKPLFIWHSWLAAIKTATQFLRK
jgi:hypothetical protein